MAECIACKASRGRIVDAFFSGYIAGQVEQILNEEHGKVVTFCLAHDKMACEAMAKFKKTFDEIAAATQAPGEGGTP